MWELGQYERARQLGEDTLTRCRRVLGEDHSDTLISADILAVTLRELEQYEAARQLGERLSLEPLTNPKTYSDRQVIVNGGVAW